MSIDLKELEKAKNYNLPIFLKLPENLVSKDIFKLVPYQFAKDNLAIPFLFDDNALIVALANPFKMGVLQQLRATLPYAIKPAFAPKEVIMQAIEKCYHQDEDTAKALIDDLKGNAQNKEDANLDFNDLLDDRDTDSNVKLLNVILTEAIQLRASDIHFEPFENDFQIRYRLDGVLQKRHVPPFDTIAPLLTRIKVLAKLDIAEHRLPQDGRIKITLGGREIDLRVSTIPVAHGERIVLRVLDKGSVDLKLDNIGMPSDLLKSFKSLISHTEGIILVTGPTGSGKTTTLYSAISEILSDEINIMTIEDPIEYKIKGIAQMGVQPKIKLDFATGLRHLLRQDPDVILIGEIRDKETAEIAVQASLTGHLVLSTLHTNDAPSAITRLIDMGIESYLLSSSIIAVLAQRLIRVLCPHCKTSYTATKEEKLELGIIEDHQLFQANGCKHCFNLGYKGRRGIYELMPVDPVVKKLITNQNDNQALKEHALKFSLKTHGRHLVLEGVTSLKELLRVIKN